MCRMLCTAVALVSLVPLVQASQPPQRPAGPGSTVARGPGARNPFVGTWKLISIERRSADGSLVPGVNPVGGVDATGTVMYDDAGHGPLPIMPSGRLRTVDML